MSFKIDKTISKISGSNNYMNELSRITGNMNTIDKDIYSNSIEKIKSIFENCIVKQLDKLSTVDSNQVEEFKMRLLKEYNQLDLNRLYQTKTHKKSGKVSTSVRIRPRDIYSSTWFKSLRQLHSTCCDMSIQFNIKSSSLSSDQINDIKLNRDTVETYKLFNLTIDSPFVCESVYVIKSFVDKIVEILLTPMYDCKSYISNHWMDQIDFAVGAEVKKKTGKSNVTRSEIQDYLYTFILAKYRLDVTGSPDQFTKVLFKQISEYDVMNMEPSRFLDVIEGFNIDSINGSTKLKSLAEMAKTEMRKVLDNKNMTPTEILRDINKFFDETINDSNNQLKQQVKKDIIENEDDNEIFN